MWSLQEERTSQMEKSISAWLKLMETWQSNSAILFLQLVVNKKKQSSERAQLCIWGETLPWNGGTIGGGGLAFPSIILHMADWRLTIWHHLVSDWPLLLQLHSAQFPSTWQIFQARISVKQENTRRLDWHRLMWAEDQIIASQYPCKSAILYFISGFPFSYLLIVSQYNLHPPLRTTLYK